VERDTHARRAATVRHAVQMHTMMSRDRRLDVHGHAEPRLAPAAQAHTHELSTGGPIEQWVRAQLARTTHGGNGDVAG